jgi:hypothetical protein
MSRDGRYIAFASTATNLVRAETGGQSIIVVRDQRLGTTQLVSRSIAGVPNGPSTHPMMAGDGWVTYTSQASNLVRGDTNDVGDAFVQAAVPAGSLARLGGAPRTQRISVSSRERQANGDSRLPVTSGRYVVFASDASNLVSGDTNNRIDVFRRDLRTGTTRRISVGPRGRQANGDSTQPVISRDGSIVLFVSSATNLVTDDTNGRVDVYAWENGRTRRVSVSQTGGQSNGDSVQPAISANGNVAAYESTGSNLLPEDTNRRMDVYRRRLDTGAASLTLVSVSSDEQQGRGGSFGPVLSATGGVVAFMSFAPNLVADDTNQAPDVFVRTPGGETERISVSSTGQQGNAASGDPSISADGMVVAFGSNAGNLVGVDDNASRDVFVHDRETGTTRPVSVRGRRTFVSGDSGNASISANGRLIVFTSVARRLVDGDTNGVADIFLRNRATSVTRRVSVGVSGQANGASDDPVISPGGGDVVFSSVASNLVAGDTNRARDVFRRRF